MENIYIFIGGFTSFLGLYNQSIINSIVSQSGTFINSDTTSKVTMVCFLLNLNFTSFHLSKYVSSILGLVMVAKNLVNWHFGVLTIDTTGLKGIPFL